jgi:hypothetical protein
VRRLQMKNAHSGYALSTGPWSLVLCILVVYATAFSQEALPTNNLDLPVMIRLPSGTGSGFLVTDSTHWYLVTARHVLFRDTLVKDARGDTSRVYILLDTSATISGYTAGQRYTYTVDLGSLEKDGLVKPNTLHDVAVARLGEFIFDSSGGKTVANHRYLRRTEGPDVRTTSALWTTLRRYEQVMVGNDVFVFGYPTSIGLKRTQQIDYERPLIHKGIVAGKNPAKRTLVIDAAVYGGNSGGPVLEVEEPGATGGPKFLPIGVAIEYVPFLDEWRNNTRRYSYSTITTSDYSIVEPLDPVIDMIRSWK